MYIHVARVVTSGSSYSLLLAFILVLMINEVSRYYNCVLLQSKMSDNNSESSSSQSVTNLLDSAYLSSPGVKRPIGQMKRIKPSKTIIVSEQDKAMLDEHLKYHRDMTRTIKRCRAGFTTNNTRMPHKPKSKIETILKGIQKKRVSKASTTINVLKMDHFEFDQYLRSKLINFSDVIADIELDMADMDGFAKELKRLNGHIKHDNSKSLKEHFRLGDILEFAFKKFTAEKRKAKSEETWKHWIEQNTDISGSYSRRLREMACLANKFSKLKDLGLSITDFFKFKGKIEQVLGSNINLARAWQ